MIRKKITLVFLVVLLVVAAGCSSKKTAQAIPPTYPPEPTPTTPSAYQPDMALFETVWQTVRDNFYDPNMNGVDWQAIHDEYAPLVAAVTDGESYYRLLNAMLFELGVSHIGLLPPEMADELDPITFLAGSLGFDVRLLDEQVMITAVQPDSPAAREGLQPGFVVTAVNGLTPDELLQQTLQMPPLNERDRRGMITQAVRAELYGEPGQSVAISFLDGEDGPVEVSLKYAPRQAKQTEVTPDLPPAYVEFEAYRLAPDIGYLRFSGFLPGVAEDALAAIDEMRDTETLIIDIRGNPGGVFPVRKALAEKLVGEPVLFWMYNQRSCLETVYLDDVADAYEGNIIILIDELSASSSEEFAGGLQAIDRAIIVGQRSPGRCLIAEIFPLENGAILVYPHGQSQTAGGYVLENNGVVPDIEVRLDRTSLLAGRDVQLEAAINAVEE